MLKRLVSKKGKEGILCLWTVCFIFVLVLCYFLFHSNTVNAKENSDAVKYYTSVYIEPGDTLTSIAKEYQTVEYSDLSAYIEEIKYVNDLHSDKITAGCYLVVPYYAEENK
ncbi:MAG: LysM peptidoglycan-binding domain-containing protein [Lachnospiraceae bacterium]|nr:LysM peptidoglycan-binding domain-containing protein [Lachnospiraceae bacterium]